RPEAPDVRRRVIARLIEAYSCDVAVLINLELHAELDRLRVVIARHGGDRGLGPDGTWAGAQRDRNGDARGGNFDIGAVVYRAAAQRHRPRGPRRPRVGPAVRSGGAVPRCAAIFRDFNGADSAA